MKIIEKTFNVETGEETIIERDETSAETKERLDYAKEIATKQAEADAKAAAKETVFEKLGLSAEEVAALLG
jgi:hypothetical protein